MTEEKNYIPESFKKEYNDALNEVAEREMTKIIKEALDSGELV